MKRTSRKRAPLRSVSVFRRARGTALLAAVGVLSLAVSLAVVRPALSDEGQAPSSGRTGATGKATSTGQAATSGGLERPSLTDPQLSDSWLSETGATGTPTTLASIRTMIGADTGPAASLTGAGVGVALIDTGIAPVPGLPPAQMVNGPDLSFESQAPNLRYLDGYGHGTHIAGIIAANDVASGTRGLAPGVKLTSVKAGTGNGAVDVTQMIAAVDWVVQHRNDDPSHPIRVLNLSFGAGGSPQPWNDPLHFAVEQAWKAGIVVVAAAGNQGNGYGKLANPASDQWVLAIGAAATNGTTTTSDDTIASYSNMDISRLPDLVAPGESVASLRVPGSNIDTQYPGARVGDTLFKGSGTSQAAAVASAAAALLLQYRPSLTSDQVKKYLVDGRKWLPKGMNGLGEINVSNAIASLSDKPYLTPQSWMWGSGSGPLEASRGTRHVVSGSTPLTGDNSIFGTFSPKEWAAKSAANVAWSGGMWMGHPLAGDSWSGVSWTSRSWACGVWPSPPWDGAPTWDDPAWIGRYWSGRYWSNGSWIGRYWSGGDWSTFRWS